MATTSRSESRKEGKVGFNSRSERARRALIYLALIAGAIFVLLPFAWTFSTSLKAADQVFTFPPKWVPDPIVWSNYPEALTSRPFGRWFFNSLLVVIIATFGNILSCSMVAYSFARLRWPGRDVSFVILLATMMLPVAVMIIPTFILFRELNWLDTLLPITVPAFFARNAFYVFLFRQFFMTIPLELDDAARMDGASSFGIYWRIIMPMSRPAIAVVAIMFAQFKWKEFFGPLIYINDTDLYTAALGLRSFIGVDQGTDWNLMMAANIVFMIPLILVFFFLQKYFIQGIVVSGVKG